MCPICNGPVPPRAGPGRRRIYCSSDCAREGKRLPRGVCSVADCVRPVNARGLCDRHYARLRRLGDVALPPRLREPVCTIEGCEQPHRGLGLCNKHYMRERRHGDPLTVLLAEREPLCSIEGCNGRHVARGYCELHYARWQRHGDPTVLLAPRRMPPGSLCTVETCDRPYLAKGFCQAHYHRWRQTGNPLPKTVEQRFAENIEENVATGCWLWTGAGVRTGGRYGTFSANGKTWQAHRFAYELIAPIPPEHDLDHLCGVPRCVNPRHLEPVTPWENRRRAVAQRYGQGSASPRPV
jgi:hypothetical protein